ncbi:TPR end-of-group domain-containing protein [Maridesulfovibrio sp.]|uniref:TPR end-of-group domain-containing protein n=1 Tax=Maridesulfovibrio sp. TaxID=2795000 RepID=UPI003B000517
MRFISMMLLALVLVIGVCGGLGAAEKSAEKTTPEQINKIERKLFSIESDIVEIKNYQIKNSGQMWFERTKDQAETAKDWTDSHKVIVDDFYYTLIWISAIAAVIIGLLAIIFQRQQKSIALENQNKLVLKVEEITNDLKKQSHKSKKEFDGEIAQTIEDIKLNASEHKETIENDKKEFEEKLNKLFDAKKNEINILKKECEDLKEECGKLKDRCKFNADQSDEILEKHQDKVRSIKSDNKIEDMDDETKEAVEDVASSKSEEFFTRLKARALKHEMDKQWDQALQVWLTITQEFPDNYENKFKIGYLYQQMFNQEPEPKSQSEHFEKSSHYYREATIEAPKAPPVWNNWGTLLANRAKQTTGEEKVELWNKAEEKFKKATDVNPELSEPWNNWAVLLADRAKQTTGEEKEELWDKAEEKYKTATDVQPDYPKGWYNWANLLGDRAKQANGGDRLELWDEAEDKYQKATDIKPEFSEAWCNWALLLADRAKQANGENRKDIWDKAEEKFKKTTDIKPEDPEAWFYWALLLADRAKQTNGKEREELWDKAEEQYKKVTDINPEYSAAWNNWALLLDDRASQANGDERLKLWDKAEQKYKKATDIKPEYSNAWYNWAVLLAEKANQANEEDRLKLWDKAEEKFKKTTDIKPEVYDAWNNWASVLTSKATVDLQNIDTNLLDRAKEKALRSEDILEGNGAYNLACITSLQNNFEECKQWLIKSKEIGVNLPPCEHLKSDPDLDNIRTHPDYKDWFNDFVEQVCQEEQEAAAKQAEQDETDSE